MHIPECPRELIDWALFCFIAAMAVFIIAMILGLIFALIFGRDTLRGEK